MNHKDYSYINNIDDLKREISAVKIRIRQNRSQLEQRWQRMPAELVRKTGGSATPLLLNKSIAFNSWQLIRSGINYFLSQRTLSSKKK